MYVNVSESCFPRLSGNKCTSKKYYLDLLLSESDRGKSEVIIFSKEQSFRKDIHVSGEAVLLHGLT